MIICHHLVAMLFRARSTFRPRFRSRRRARSGSITAWAGLRARATCRARSTSRTRATSTRRPGAAARLAARSWHRPRLRPRWAAGTVAWATAGAIARAAAGTITRTWARPWTRGASRSTARLAPRPGARATSWATSRPGAAAASWTTVRAAARPTAWALTAAGDFELPTVTVWFTGRYRCFRHHSHLLLRSEPFWRRLDRLGYVLLGTSLAAPLLPRRITIRSTTAAVVPLISSLPAFALLSRLAAFIVPRRSVAARFGNILIPAAATSALLGFWWRLGKQHCVLRLFFEFLALQEHLLFFFACFLSLPNAFLLLALLEGQAFLFLFLSKTALFFVDSTGSRNVVLCLGQQVLALARFCAHQADVAARFVAVFEKVSEVSEKV